MKWFQDTLGHRLRLCLKNKKIKESNLKMAEQAWVDVCINAIQYYRRDWNILSHGITEKSWDETPEGPER